MSTLVIDQRNAHVAYQSGALMIRIPEQRPKSVPLRLLTRLIIAGAVTIEAPALTHLAENNISVLILPARSHRRSAFLHSHNHGDAQRRIGQYQIIIDPRQSLYWAQRLVILRMLGARRLLCRGLHRRPDQRRELIRGIDRLTHGLHQAKQVTHIDTLRGTEGAAAAGYFKAYTHLFADSLHFTGRNRRPPRDPVNATLSLGYTLIHGDAVQALARAGLDPMLGFMHEPEHNRESLACDLVELARPRIEQLTWELFRDRQLKADRFSLDKGAARMSKAARRTFFATYEQQASLHRRWFRRYARLIARACKAQTQQTIAD